MRRSLGLALTVSALLSAPALAAEPTASPAAAVPTAAPDNGDIIHKAALAPDAFLTYIQLTAPERAKYRFYARHMNETQRLEYLRRVRSADREQYARDLGLPQMLDGVPQPTRDAVVAGTVDLGMTPDQVRLALGDPAGKIQGAGTLFGKSYKSYEKWTYQRNGGPFSVWFSEGTVIGFDPSAGPPADESLPSDKH
jgi:hypothetical protein